MPRVTYLLSVSAGEYADERVCLVRLPIVDAIKDFQRSFCRNFYYRLPHVLARSNQVYYNRFIQIFQVGKTLQEALINESDSKKRREHFDVRP